MTVIAQEASPPRVRPARTTDLLYIYRLERKCFEQPWPFSAFETHVDAPGFLVAVADGQLVGFVVGAIQNGFPGPGGHIKDLAVHPQYRRQGVARHLLMQSLQRLQDAGAGRAVLEVRESNAAAISLYQSVGFHPSRRRTGYYADGEDAIVMSRPFD